MGFVILVFGCVARPVVNLSKNDEETIEHGEKSVVLLRLSAGIDSQKSQGPERFRSIMASIDTGQPPKGNFPLSFSIFAC